MRTNTNTAAAAAPVVPAAAACRVPRGVIMVPRGSMFLALAALLCWAGAYPPGVTADAECCCGMLAMGFKQPLARCCTGGLTAGACDEGCSNAVANGPYSFTAAAASEVKSVYCNTEIAGGGWHLAYTINPSDGNRMGWGGALWTQATSSAATDESVLNKDYVNAAGAGMPANEIMIVNGYKSDGTYDAYTIWPFRVSRKTLFEYVRAATSTCDDADGATFPFTARNGSASVPFDPINNQFGDLYINFGYGNNAHRFMTAGQCTGEHTEKASTLYRNGLSCTNDDAMLGLGNDWEVTYTNSNPGDISTWSHDVSVFSPDNCDGGRSSQLMGTDLSMSSELAGFATVPPTYTYTIWTRTAYNTAPGMGIRNTASSPAVSCRHAVDTNVAGAGLVWIRPNTQNSETAPFAFIAGCNLKLAGGGWTLLLTQTDPIKNFQGSVNVFVDYGDVGVPSSTEVYAHNWTNSFLPTTGDEFMIVKDGGEYVTFIVSTWCPGTSWHSLSGACGGNQHPGWASGQAYDASGNALSGVIYMNGCAYSGGCSRAGADTVAFTSHPNWANSASSCYGGCYVYDDQAGFFWNSVLQPGNHAYSVYFREKALPATIGDEQATCYLNRYADLSQAFGATNLPTAKEHWAYYGIREQRNPFCS
mmetsp:Transcript_5346/g.13635  ORF Transcript_5346/g.13635 Transcript_5346/m.13635 type:complete len:646 (-) Transcript_5346:171-2108(-)